MRDAVASVLMSPALPATASISTRARGACRDGVARRRPLDLRAGQPAQLLPLVQHARRRAAGPRPRPATCTARGAGGPGPAHAEGRRGRAAWPPSSAATGWISAASRSTTASTASASPASTTSCARRCSRSRSASSSTSSSADRSVLDFLHGKHTFVNAAAGQALRHAGARRAAGARWVRVDDADRYGRGGLLPMAVFLTKNAPGLRTSPVKRGYWVVRRVLGEQIPPPPADGARAAAATRRKMGELTAARGAGPAPRGQGLRRLPRPLRLVRPGLRGLRPGRRAARRGTSAAARSTRSAAFPGGSEGSGAAGPARATCARTGRTTSSTTCAASCWPTRWGAA